MSIVYLAGPLFSDQDRQKLEEIAKAINDRNVTVFVPHIEAGLLDSRSSGKDKHEVFTKDIEAIKSCRIVVALLDGSDVDSGTAVEIGYAYALGKKIIGLLTDRRKQHSNVNNMIWGTCTIIENNIESVADDVQHVLTGRL